MWGGGCKKSERLKLQRGRERETTLQITAVGNTSRLTVFSPLLNVSCGEMRAVGLECSSDRDKITTRVHAEAK